MSETVQHIPLPIMDTIRTAILSTKGEFRKQLDVGELKDLVGSIIPLALAKYPQFNLTVQNPLVEIDDAGKLTFDTKVSCPLPSATVHVRANWQNDDTPGVLKTTGFTYEVSTDPITETVMEQLGIETTVRSYVTNPNKTLGGVIQNQMSLRGIHVTAAGFVIEDQKLRVVVKGEKMK